jgi:hypothetical protein
MFKFYCWRLVWNALISSSSAQAHQVDASARLSSFWARVVVDVVRALSLYINKEWKEAQVVSDGRNIPWTVVRLLEYKASFHLTRA